MTGTLERVARAIWEATPSHSPSKGNGSQAWQVFKNEACAAIEATRVRQWRMWAHFWCYIAVIMTGTLFMVVVYK